MLCFYLITHISAKTTPGVAFLLIRVFQRLTEYFQPLTQRIPNKPKLNMEMYCLLKWFGLVQGKEKHTALI